MFDPLQRTCLPGKSAAGQGQYLSVYYGPLLVASCFCDRCFYGFLDYSKSCILVYKYCIWVLLLASYEHFECVVLGASVTISFYCMDHNGSPRLVGSAVTFGASGWPLWESASNTLEKVHCSFQMFFR